MPLAFLLGLFVPVTCGPDPAVSATVWVRVGDRTTGTGWVADRERRWVVTARHVLGGQKTADICFHTAYAGIPITDRDVWLKQRTGLKATGRIASAKLVATAETADLVLLQAESIPPDIPALAVSGFAAAGTKCHSVGHRHDAPTLWTRTDGIIRQAGRLTDGYFWAGRKLGVGANVAFAHLPIDLGDSGSPVVDTAGRVIGVVSAISDRTPGLAILTAADEVSRLLDDDRGVKKPAADPPPELPKVLRATVWIRPQATDGRFAGAVTDRARRLVLTSATAVGSEDLTDVVLPHEKDGRVTSEAEAYADRLGLILSGQQVRAVVLARDSACDLALLELRNLPPTVGAVTVAKTDSKPGKPVGSVSHPPGLEFLWLYAAGTVRGTANAVLQRDPEGAGTKVPSLLLQLPHQGSAAGGPVVDDRGELVTILAGREAGRNELAIGPASSAVRAFLQSARPLTDPRSAAEWHRRGNFLRDRGDSAGGLEAHQQAARLAPTDRVIQATWALAVAEAGPAGEVVDALAGAQKLSDRTPEADALLAAAYSAAGQKDDATRVAARALAADPKQPLALLIRSRTEPTAEAIRTLNEVLSLAPSNATAYRERAERGWSADSGKEQALADATRAVELAPHDARARRLRAELLGDAREWKKAAREYARLVEANPRAPESRARLARARLKAGEDGPAMEAVTDLVRLDETGRKAGFAVIREHGANLVGEDRGNATRAAEWYRTALRGIRPRLPTTEQKRADDLLRETEKMPAAEAVRRMAEAAAQWER
jgi:tetratricopeptide (TPR) repeat protein/S1-C subfamily serine protease